MRSVFLIRHGIAAPRGSYRRDPDRPLSDQGAKRTALCAKGFALLAQPQVILSSTFLRARQTAELFSQALSPEPDIKLLEELAPVRDAAALLARVNAERGAAVALVGHEPDMSELAGLLIAGGRRRVNVEFKKAAACRIDFHSAVQPGGGTLIWLLPPKVLQMLAE